MDEAARKLGMDSAEIRRRNFISSGAFPYTTATGLVYDSGDFVPAFDRALEMVGYNSLRDRQHAQSGSAIRTGIGIATVIKASGGKAGVRKSLARVEIKPEGRVLIFTDVSPHGQGTATSFAQIAADTLCIDPSQVEVHHGDTDELASGGGTTSSRGLAVGGNAVFIALQEVRERLGLADGLITGHDLVVEAEYELPANPFAFAAHVAVVELDLGTGDVKLTDYSAVHDCGPMINPIIVKGQIEGGIAQGVGQALSEAMSYSEDGQPQTGSLMTINKLLHQRTPWALRESGNYPPSQHQLQSRTLSPMHWQILELSPLNSTCLSSASASGESFRTLVLGVLPGSCSNRFPLSVFVPSSVCRQQDVSRSHVVNRPILS